MTTATASAGRSSSYAGRRRAERGLGSSFGRARALLIVLGVTTNTRAAPQWSSAIVAGVAGSSDGPSPWERTQFYGGARGDVLFLRDGPRDPGIGPSLELATAGFGDFRATGGLTALFPLGDLWAVALRPGAYAHVVDSGTFPGASARGWFGIQTYNYDGAYAPRGGLVFGYDHDFGGSKTHAIVIAAEVDGLVLALPVVLLFEWLRGPPRDD